MIVDLVRRNILRKKNGLPPIKIPGAPPTLEELYRTQWSNKFEKLMRNRLAMGYFRYAPLSKQKKGEMKNIDSIKKRTKLYEKTGNDELLVDIANICLVEFLLGDHPLKHFSSKDDGIHVEKTNNI